MKKFLTKFIKFLFNIGLLIIFLFWLESQYHLVSVVNDFGNNLLSPALGWFLTASVILAAWFILWATFSFFLDIIGEIKNFLKGGDRFDIFKLISKIIADIAAYISTIFMSLKLIPYVGEVLALIHLGLMMLVVVVLFEPGSLLVSLITTGQSGGYEFLLILKIATALYLFALILFYIIIARSEEGLKRQVSFISSAIINLFTIDALMTLLGALGATEKLPLIAPRIYSLITAAYFFFAKFFPVGVAVGIALFLIPIFLYWLPNGLIHFIFTGKISSAESEKLRHLGFKVFLAVVLTAAIYFTAWPNRFNLRFFYWLSKLFDEKSLKDELLIHYANVLISGFLTAWLLAISSQFLKPIFRLTLKLFASRPHRATVPVNEKTG